MRIPAEPFHEAVPIAPSTDRNRLFTFEPGRTSWSGNLDEILSQAGEHCGSASIPSKPEIWMYILSFGFATARLIAIVIVIVLHSPGLQMDWPIDCIGKNGRRLCCGTRMRVGMFCFVAMQQHALLGPSPDASNVRFGL